MSEEIKKVKVSVYLPPENYKVLQELSDFSGINKSALAAMAAQAGLGSLDKILRGKKFETKLRRYQEHAEKKKSAAAGGA